ncbi:MAG: penicillin-binding protein 2 [Pseudomonadota bacterium]
MFIRNQLDERGARALFSRRAAVVTGLQAIGFSVLAGRLYQLQVMEENRFAPLADTNRITTSALAPIRGIIYDRAGRVLADNIENFRVVVVPSLAGDIGNVLSKLAQVMDLDLPTRQELIARSRRQSPNAPLVVADNLSFETIARVNVLAPQLPGIETVLIGQRRYFQGRELGLIVGHVGSVERFALDDDPVLRLPGMRVGKIGIERGMERRLRGEGGSVKREVDARGRVVRDLERREPKRGRDLVLSVDAGLQHQILDRLSKVRRGAVVVLDVKSGDVLSMASWPTVDITDLGDGITQEAWTKLRKTSGDPMFHRPIKGLYPPGSTFKMVTMLAGLESGEVTLGEKINCQGTYVYAGQKFRCWNRSGHGRCNAHRALRESCDTWYYEVAKRVGIVRISEMAERLGFGQTYDDLGLAFQAAGIIPDPTWKRGYRGKRWLGGETLLSGIGQGYVATTPLQLAVMTARLATGRAIEPHLVLPDKLGTERTFAPLDVDPEHLQAVRRAMNAVVHERRGTGKRARLEGSGIEIAGKTGTAQVSRLSSYRSKRRLPWKYRDHALFVSYFPYVDPRYAVSVVVEHGGSGGKIAAPLAADVMRILLAYEKQAAPPFRVGGRSSQVSKG